MTFQAMKRSMRTLEGFRFWGAIFCLPVKDWFVDTLEPSLLVLDVALDGDALAFIVVYV